MNRNYDCFISYRRSTGFYLARIICDRLKQQGINCYFDYEAARAGEFESRIRSAIEKSSFFILVLTPGCFDRCKEERDWFREEMELAVAMKKKIIPIRTDGFKWPEDESLSIITRIRAYDSLWIAPEYFEEAVARLLQFMRTESGKCIGQNLQVRRGNRSVDFFLDSFATGRTVKEICMAFHAGSFWKRTTEKAELLSELIKNKIQLRILINSENTINPIVKHMRHPLKKYLDIDENISEWKALKKEFPEEIDVRVTDYPIFHRTYLICYEDETGNVSVRNYRYGDYSSDEEDWILFEENWEAFRKYKEEFDYIWNRLSTKI